MGWYAVAQAIKSGDGQAVADALAQEEDPARSMQVARAILAEQDYCQCGICLGCEHRDGAAQ